MTRCYDEGVLRSYLDNELAPETHRHLEAHIATCHVCHERLEHLRLHSAEVRMLLKEPASVPDPHIALQQFRQATLNRQQMADRSPQVQPLSSVAEASSISSRVSVPISWRTIMKNIFGFMSGHYRTTFAGAITVVVLLGVLFVPPLRAMAEQFLQVFRVQNVVFVPINQDHMEELENLDFDGETLFMSEPTAINEPGEPRIVADVDEAAEYVEFAPGAIEDLPDDTTLTEMAVMDRATYEFEVNVETSQQLLDMLNINETIPAELGDAPITIDLPASITTQYSSEAKDETGEAVYTLTLHQGLSPEISLPEDVDLAKLGKVALLLLGMEPNQAEALSQEIDWSTTLIYPFDPSMDNIQQVQINGAKGILTNGYGEFDGEEMNWKTLYWQDGEHFYVLVGEGRVSTDTILDAAESMR